jgi:ubiquinone/menaquinone biosynthesis C-methylase UbiE
MSDQFVQYGCGLSAPQGWRNFDASPTLRLQRLPALGFLVARRRVMFPQNVEYGDIARGLPVTDETCEAVYCSHVLEHLSLKDLRDALSETYRILKPGGVFRGVLPDLSTLIHQYISDPTAEAAISFMNSSLLGVAVRKRGIRGALENAFGNNRHLWMWDFKGLAKELSDAGFHDIRRAQFGDNPAPHFVAVENEERWRDCLGFECRR